MTTAKTDLGAAMRQRASAIAASGGLQAALDDGKFDPLIDTTLSEALVLGLLKQGVRKYLAIFGHGSTDLGEVLRIYEEAGATRTYNCRNEVAMAHAATALRWQYGETAAVVTSIGPGAMQAYAGALAAASNGVGVYHIYGDETTFGEGYNMQQVPKEEQGLFGQMTAILGRSYTLHTPEAIRDALRRGAMQVYPSLSCRAVLPAAAAQHAARATAAQSRGAARASRDCPRWRRLVIGEIDGGGHADRGGAQGHDQGRRRHARPRCGDPQARRSSRRRRRAVARLDRRAARCASARTCTSPARRARSAATSRRPRPSC